MFSEFAMIRKSLLAIFTSIQFVSGFRSDVILRVFMINPLLHTNTLVKRNATLPFFPHKLFNPTCMSVRMHFQCIKRMKVSITKLTGKRFQQSNFHFYNLLYRFLSPNTWLAGRTVLSLTTLKLLPSQDMVILTEVSLSY